MTTSSLFCADALDFIRSNPDDYYDLIIGSPPYAEKGERYGTSKKWKTADWVDWMLDITIEACRVTREYVVWVANGAVRQRRYLPACEGLIWKAHEAGIVCERPVIWHKNSPPSRKDWLGNDWEFCLVFKPDDGKRFFDWEKIAEEPKYTSGGHFRQRTSTGERRRGSDYPQNKLARPRDVWRVLVGGGHMGHELAHENEAPFPEKLIEPFVLACCPVGGHVLDPFMGSGTTGAVAIRHRRNFTGVDSRVSQIKLAKRRLGIE